MGPTLQYDHYKVLGIPRNASAETVKRAYRERAKAYHPDRNPSANAVRVFHAVHEAYTVLCDPELREQYDARLAYHRPAAETQTPKADPAYRRRNDPSIDTEDTTPATPFQRAAFYGLHLTGLLFGIATVGTILVGITFYAWPAYMLFFSLPGVLAIPESMDGLRSTSSLRKYE